MRKSCVSDTDVHGATSYVKSSIITGVSIAQVRTGVVHVLRESGSRLLRLQTVPCKIDLVLKQHKYVLNMF